MAAGQLVTTLMTADEFAQLADDGMRHELVAGEVMAKMPPGGIHGAIAGRLVRRLLDWIDAGAGSSAGVEAGFILAHDPDTVRAPDVAYVTSARIPSGGVPEGFWSLAPDLAVEIVSPSETADEVRDKIREYLQAGTSVVWVVYPRNHEVLAYTPDGRARTFGPSDTLEDAAMLPGFSCPVAALFQ
jgi:Uma2 family endonuclease